MPGEDFTLDVNQIIVGKTDRREPRSTTFYGNLVNFYFDGENLFQGLRTEVPVDFAPTTSPSVPTVPGVLTPTNPITFPPGFIHYIRISLIHIAADTRIRFMFKTTDGNGVLLYTSRPGGNFLGVELVDGQLVAVAAGGTGPRYVYMPTGSASLADGQWHELDLTRAGPHRFLIRIDGRELVDRLYYPTLPFADQEPIYIGGVPENLINHLPPVMRSRKGFIGCMASLVINEYSYNLQDLAARIPGVQLVAGCTDGELNIPLFPLLHIMPWLNVT